jgi:hypothetical protein
LGIRSMDDSPEKLEKKNYEHPAKTEQEHLRKE